jgi:hypothetical protein
MRSTLTQTPRILDRRFYRLAPRKNPQACGLAALVILACFTHLHV